VGQLAMATLVISTKALNSGSTADDSRYAQLEGQLNTINVQRDSLAAQMIAALENAEFGGKAISSAYASTLIQQGDALLQQVNQLAAQP
jgi:hypothetical protein